MASGLPADKRILQVAAEVAETSDDNVPVVLLGLKGILNDHPLGSSQAQDVRADLWNYDLMQVINLVLKQNFEAVPGQLNTAAELCVILSSSCCGLKLKETLEFQKQFLPNVLETILSILCQVSERLGNINNGREKDKLVNKARDVSNAVIELLHYHRFLSLSVLSSKRFLQLLMAEDDNISLVVMDLIIAVIRTDSNVFADLPEAKLHSIVDELVFKLSAAMNATVASTSTRVLLFCLDSYPPLIDLLTSKRYKGLKAYLGKWKGKGFARDIMRLTRVLEARSAQQVEMLRISVSAAKIQAAFKGYKTRQRLSKASKAIGHFQRLYRLRKGREVELKQEQELMKTQQEIDNRRRRREFLTSRTKQLKIMETMPANTVNSFLQDLQVISAIKIQSAWRGHKTRTINKAKLDEIRRFKAAVRIQKQVRKWIKRRKDRQQRIINDLYPAGLDDDRRVHLQTVIANVREQFPAKSRDLEDVKKLHDTAHNMLSSYYAQLPTKRRQDEHRYALMAQITILSQQLSMAPHLREVSGDDIARYTSQSTPVVLAAKRQHQETLTKMQRRWWEKLADDDERSNVEKGSEFKVIPDPEKQF